MTYVDIALFLALFSSISVNLYLALRTVKVRPQTQSQELQEFLVDLMGGSGVVQVSRIDPNAILLRSPRQK